MTQVLLFHHAHGLTAGVHAFADRLRSEGHVVDTPDLFDGRTFTALDEGVAHAEHIGFGSIIERGAAAAGDRRGPVVYAGFSLGVLPAQMLAQTRPNAVGALLYHSCVPTSEFGSEWPQRVPVQIHAMDADPYFVDDGDLDAATELVRSTPAASLYLYPGGDHLFTDETLSCYDAGATADVVRRTLTLLDS